jgi:hypothetical protein
MKSLRSSRNTDERSDYFRAMIMALPLVQRRLNWLLLRFPRVHVAVFKKITVIYTMNIRELTGASTLADLANVCRRRNVSNRRSLWLHREVSGVSTKSDTRGDLTRYQRESEAKTLRSYVSREPNIVGSMISTRRSTMMEQPWIMQPYGAGWEAEVMQGKVWWIELPFPPIN